ncbi:MAG: hypothetical protein ACKPKO_51935 [Candidatus Fonsibacter sp.]
MPSAQMARGRVQTEQAPRQLSEKQRRLVVNIWFSERRDCMSVEKGNRLAAKARTAVDREGLLASCTIRRAAHTSAVVDGVPVMSVGNETLTDDQVFDVAMQRAKVKRQH